MSQTIKSFMSDDHRACDDVFAKLENLVDTKKWDEASSAFGEFEAHFLRHFKMEEDVIFPRFNECSGGGCNPTTVMIMEHNQMRATIENLKKALDAKNRDAFLGHSENFMFLVQQHNMKEEQIMYNLADNAIGSQVGAVLEQAKAIQ